eukprot:1803726-Amphidinium_carterae.1
MTQTNPKLSKPPLPRTTSSLTSTHDSAFDFAASNPWAEGDECAVHNAAAGLATLTTAPPPDCFDEDDVEQPHSLHMRPYLAMKMRNKQH